MQTLGRSEEWNPISTLFVCIPKRQAFFFFFGSRKTHTHTLTHAPIYFFSWEKRSQVRLTCCVSSSVRWRDSFQNVLWLFQGFKAGQGFSWASRPTSLRVCPEVPHVTAGDPPSRLDQSAGQVVLPTVACQGYFHPCSAQPRTHRFCFILLSSRLREPVKLPKS